MGFGKSNFLFVAVVCAVVVTMLQVTESSEGVFGSRGSVDDPYPYHQPLPQNQQFSCKKHGFYADKINDCKGFYRCVEGNTKPYYFDCSPGTLFNEKISICDHPGNVYCK